MQIIVVISILYASLIGITQTKLKRLLAYSSVVNMSYVLLCFTPGISEAYVAGLQYMMIYVITNICLFSFLLYLRYFVNGRFMKSRLR
jgi:NADH-quinone oxidoreductase subunit N